MRRLPDLPVGTACNRFPVGITAGRESQARHGALALRREKTFVRPPCYLLDDPTLVKFPSQRRSRSVRARALLQHQKNQSAMCGIAGLHNLRNEPIGGLSGALGLMSDLLAHRGPDDEATWTSDSGASGFRVNRQQAHARHATAAGMDRAAAASGVSDRLAFEWRRRGPKTRTTERGSRDIGAASWRRSVP